MKKMFLVIALVVVLVLPLSAANYMKTNGLGVGLNVGYPGVGAAVKYAMNDFRAVGTVGYGYSGTVFLEAGAQYDVYEFAIGDIPFFLNVGVTGTVSAPTDFKSFKVSANVPVGVSYFFEKLPIEAFLKVGPGVAILPKLDFDINASLGALYYLD